MSRMLDVASAALRDVAFRWPELDEAAAAELCDVARAHGVHLLLAERMLAASAADPESAGPPALQRRLFAALRNQFALEAIARGELSSVIDALQQSGAATLLFKGTALAYTLYPHPHIRPRADTDLFVAPARAAPVGAVLERMGYTRAPLVTGDLVMYQAVYSRTDARGVPHTIDLHWRISNPQIFAQKFDADELSAAAIAVPALSSVARAVGAIHALAIACIHRVAHHAEEDRLIWTYDIHLLAEHLTDAERERFVSLVTAKQLVAVCADGLALAHRTFGGAGTASLLARLIPSKAPLEASAVYLIRGRRKVDVLVSDLRALRGLKERSKLIREHLLPSAKYMRETYGIRAPALLPFYYVWRIARGAREWFRSTPKHDSR
jgi:hypothetical protein